MTRFPVAIRRALQARGAAPALLVAALALLAMAGCSKSVTQPTPGGPTRFVVFSSDRDRVAGGYRSQICDLGGTGTSAFNFTTSNTVVDRHPSITQDGGTLCYQTGPGRGGSQDVILYRRGSGAVVNDTLVNSLADETEPYLSLDGARLAFVRDTLGVKRIRLFDPATRKFVPLPGLDPASSTANDWAPALDAQARRLAFVSDRNGNPDVFVYQIATLGLMTGVTAGIAAGNDLEPALSGNGRYLAWASDRAGGAGGFDVRIHDLNSLIDVTMPGNSAGDDREPSLSNDGTYMVFMSSYARPAAKGGKDLWNINLATSTLWQASDESDASDDFDPVLVWP